MDESLLDPVIEQIRAVPFPGDKLDAEMKRITAILKNPDPEKWDEREKTIKRLAGMAMAHEVEDEEFLKHLRLMRTTLATQVEDLRSSIVRTSAAACVILNEELFPGFISVFESLLPSFIRQLAVKAIPTRESSHECIARISSTHPNDKILKQLIGYQEDKDKIIRTRVSQFVLGICNQWPQEDLQRNIRAVLNYLRYAIGDGDNNVRTNARGSVAALGENFPTAVAQFYRGTDDAKQKKELHKVLPPSVLALVASTQSTGALDIPSSGLQQAPGRRSTGGMRLGAPSPQPRVGRASVGASPVPPVQAASSGPSTPVKNQSAAMAFSLAPRSARASTSSPDGLVPKLGPGRGRTSSQPPMAMAADIRGNSNSSGGKNGGGGAGGRSASGSASGSGLQSAPQSPVWAKGGGEDDESGPNPRVRPIRVKSNVLAGAPMQAPSARMRRQSQPGEGSPVAKQNSIPAERKVQQARALADFGDVEPVAAVQASGAGPNPGQRPARARSEMAPAVSKPMTPSDSDAILRRLQALRDEVNRI